MIGHKTHIVGLLGIYIEAILRAAVFYEYGKAVNAVAGFLNIDSGKLSTPGVITSGISTSKAGAFSNTTSSCSISLLQADISKSNQTTV